MKKVKDGVTNFVKNNTVKLLVGMMVLNTFGSWWPAGKDVFSIISNDKIGSVMTLIVRESVKRELEGAMIAYSLELIELETRGIRTAEQMDKKVKTWHVMEWNAQLAALKIVSESKIARKKLEELIYDKSIYKALLSTY